MSQIDDDQTTTTHGIVVLDPRSDEELDREEALRRGALDHPDGPPEREIPGVRVHFGRVPAPFPHAPGLDGLRGLAVVAVLLYHAHFGFARGGFLGVSVFFTLSGYLITSLLLRERARDGAVSLRGFWSRRFRRLLPASFAAQGLILAMAAFGVWDGDQLRALRTDIPAALAQVVNISFIVRGTSYVTSTTAPSPLNHYWSLSLEEQFYLLFPLIVAGALLLGRSRRRVLVPMLVLGTAASAVACWYFARTNVDRAYFGLDTRVAELLIGALLACGTLYRVRLTNWWQRQAVAVAGLGGVAALVWLTMVATVSTPWLYPWGLLLTAAATSSIIFAAVQSGVVTKLMSFPGFTEAGRISYGLYLYHWPIFLWLTPRRTGLDQWPLFGLRMAITIAVALASYHLLEQPIRSRRALAGRVPLFVAPVMAVAIIAALLWTTSSLPPRDVSLEGSSSASATSPRVAAAIPAPPQRMLIVGDESATALGAAAPTLAKRNVEAKVMGQLGCGAGVGGTRLVSGQPPAAVNSPACAQLPTQWSAGVAQFLPDVVVVSAGEWDVTDRQFWSEDPVRRPGDQVFDDFLATEISTRVDELSAQGATVVWLTLPYVRKPLPGVPGPPEALPENDPARVDRYNAVLASVAQTEPKLKVLDLAKWAAARPGGVFDAADRPDGATFAPAAATDAANWLATQVKGLRRTVDTTPAAAAAMTDPSSDASMPPAPVLPPRIVPGPGEPARVLVVGDSVAFGLGFGLSDWANGRHDVVFDNKGQFNCPVARGGSYRFEQEVAEFPDRCDWAAEFPGWLAASRPHEVVLSTGVWDVVDRILPNDRKWRHLGDSVSDTYFLREMLTAIDLLSSQGARVVLLTHHHIDVGANKGFSDLPESDPARIDRLNELLAKAQALRPNVTSIVDAAGWVKAQPGGELDPAKLKDGLHYSDAYLNVLGKWLGPELLAQIK
ncbi:MAG: acyltransferase family protein [Acidimicrobiales bacterium]